MPISDHTNFGYSTLATAPSGTSGTSLVVASGHGALFPTAPFNAVIWPADAAPVSTNAEIVRVTAKASDTFTITRAQEGTSARTHLAGAQIAAGVTKRVLTDVEYGAHKIVNVMDPAYGATGDGTTDDTAAIQAAIDAVEALSGGELYFPKGTFKTTAELTVTQPMVIRGAGRGVTTIYATTLGTDNGILLVTSSNVTIRDMTVRGPSSAAYVLDECAVWFKGTSGTPLYNNVIENVETYNAGGYGILFEYSHRSTARGCYSHDNGYMGITGLSSNDLVITENTCATMTPGTASNAYGIYVGKRLTGDGTPTRWHVTKNIVNDVALWEGIDTHGGSYGNVEGNIVTGCKVGIQCGPDSFGNVPHFTKVVGNVISKGSLTTTQLRGISCGGDSSTNAKGMVIADNTVDGMGGADGSDQLLAAILVQYTDGAKVDNNTIFDAEQNGIVINVGATAISVTNNTVRGVTNRTGNSSALRFNVASTGVCTGNYLDASDNYPLYFNAACPGLRMDDTNVLITDGTAPASGVTTVTPASAGRGFTAWGTATADLGNLVDGAGTNVAVTVTGAALGDIATASCSLAVQDMILSAVVSATNTVRIRVQNETGGDLDLASATWTARTVRP